VLETVDPTGLEIRKEVDEDEEPIDRDLIRRRMEEHRRRAATRPIASVATLHLSGSANGYDPFVDRDCPPEGSATEAHKIEQNQRKNRLSTPTATDIESSVTLSELRRSGNDTNRWSPERAATIVGYIRSVKGTGAESCNCGETSRCLTDTHIDVVSGPSDHRKPVIVEITPVWRLMHEHQGIEDWSSAAVKAKYEGHRVRITGWLFFDDAHLLEADNTDPGDHHGKKNWRKTCWEIHPVTKIEILP